MLWVYEQSAGAGLHDKVHVLHRDGAEERLAVAGQHHGALGGAAVCEAQFEGADDVALDYVALGQFGRAGFEGGQAKLLPDGVVDGEHVGPSVHEENGFHLADFILLDDAFL